VKEWSKDQRLDDEKTLLGYYTSGHPLDAVRTILNNDRLTKINTIEEVDIKDRKIRRIIGGMIKSVDHRTTKAGKPFGIITIEDLTGVRELFSWAESYTPAREEGLLESGNVVRMNINIQEDDRGEQRRVSGSQIKSLTTKKSTKAPEGLNLNLWTSRHTQEDLDYILETIKKYPGKSDITITIQNTLGNRTQLTVPDKLKVRLNPDMDRELERFIG
jgi:DNA polymerase-3 subunit alpha